MTQAEDHRLLHAPLIVTATMGVQDFRRFDALRRQHFPPERNVIPAHITLFHHLPPARLPELARLISDIARDAPPCAMVSDLMFMGRGSAYRVHAPDLIAIRERIADWFADDLIPQDQHVPRLHITVQNKVAPPIARALYEQLSAEFEPHPLRIAGLAIWSYLDGPWRLRREVAFRSPPA